MHFDWPQAEEIAYNVTFENLSSGPLNIAEGNGKPLKADRRRFFEIARGSALECAAIQDVLIAAMALAIK